VNGLVAHCLGLVLGSRGRQLDVLHRIAGDLSLSSQDPPRGLERPPAPNIRCRHAESRWHRRCILQDQSWAGPTAAAQEMEKEAMFRITSIAIGSVLAPLLVWSTLARAGTPADEVPVQRRPSSTPLDIFLPFAQEVTNPSAPNGRVMELPGVPEPIAAPANLALLATGQWVLTEQFGWLWISFDQGHGVANAARLVYEYTHVPTLGWRRVVVPRAPDSALLPVAAFSDLGAIGGTPSLDFGSVPPSPPSTRTEDESLTRTSSWSPPDTAPDTGAVGISKVGV